MSRFNLCTVNMLERDCIVISDSDSDVHDVDIVENAFLKKTRQSANTRSKITSFVSSPVKKKPSSEIKNEMFDTIINKYKTILRKKKKRKHHTLPKRKHHSSFNENSREISKNSMTTPIVRDESKCKLGLRKRVKTVLQFQMGDLASEPKRVKSENGEKDFSDEEINHSQATMSPYDLTNSPTKKKLFTRRISSDSDFSSFTNSSSDKKSSDQESGSSSEGSTRNVLLTPAQCTRKNNNFISVSQNKIDLKDICLSCGTTNVVSSHPLFKGGLCKVHNKMFKEWFFKVDKDGSQSYCSVCCMGDKVVICDQPDCGKCYCFDCITNLISPDEYKKVTSTRNWKCYICVDGTDESHLIRKRNDWQTRLEEMRSGPYSKYPPIPIPCPVPVERRKPIRVLSLFDGIATGLLALKQLGIQVEKFVASEIDENAIRLVQNRHPEVIHVGDITRFSDDDVIRHGPFDLVIGGSPCNDLSGANPRRRGLLDVEGTGCLFFDFFRILNVARPPRPFPGCTCDAGKSERPFFWLFENVLSMKLIERIRISRFLDCEPIVANASKVSAAARPRLFWGNIPHMKQLSLTPSQEDLLNVQSCLEPGRVATVDKLNTITTKDIYVKQGNVKQAPVTHNGKDDTLWSTEIERIFGVPEHYTDVNNMERRGRLALLGRSWSVPVIRQIFAPLKEYFASNTSSQ